MSVALVVIATGKKYHQYIDPLLESAREYFVPHTPILWTDALGIHKAFQFYLENEGYPNTTLHRYHTLLKNKEALATYDYIYYVDVDMRFISSVKEEDVFSNGITATLHPGYTDLVGTPERRPESKAYIPPTADNQYFCGGFIGGTAEAFLTMSECIASAVEEDTKNGIKAIWNDESHSNRFLYYNPPARILDPSYCYPESEYLHPGGYYSAIWRMGGRVNITPKLLALDKGPR
jgi:Glycosyltransferase family 6